MLDHNRLRHSGIDVAFGDVRAHIEALDRGELPLLVLVEGGHVDTARNKDRIAGRLGDRLKGTLDSVKDVVHNTCRTAARTQQSRDAESPGPSSTESEVPVRMTGSPTVSPEVSSYTYPSPCNN